jgi:signal transduction histidine kinase
MDPTPPSTSITSESVTLTSTAAERRASESRVLESVPPAGMAPACLAAPSSMRLEELLQELLERGGQLVTAHRLLPGLLNAVAAVASDLNTEVTLRRIAETARILVNAKYAALGVIGKDRRHLSHFVPVGFDEHLAARIGDPPHGRGVLGVLLTEPKPLRLADLTAHPGAVGFPPSHPSMRTFLGVPIMVRGVIFGNLYLAEKAEGAEFTADDEDVVVALAGAAGVAIRNARLYEDAQRAQQDLGRLAVYEDRDRIARDLHDLVIQRLFATGLSLQGLGAYLGDAGAEARLDSAINDLDETIREIRRTIFSLQQSDPLDVGLRARVLEVISQNTAALGFEPHIRLEGPLDDRVPAPVQGHIIAVLRELLANVARHARATATEILVRAEAESVTVRVADDGVGLGSSQRRSGLANIRERAQCLAGSVGTSAGLQGNGTAVMWTVPLLS